MSCLCVLDFISIYIYIFYTGYSCVDYSIYSSDIMSYFLIAIDLFHFFYIAKANF